MEKRLLTILIIISLVFSTNSFSSIVSGDDGAAFVTKEEFETLKVQLDEQIEKYNNSIDRKIDGMIANYIAAIRFAKIPLASTLNTFTEKRRTFYNEIKNPTTSGQNDLYISTCGLWTWSQPTPYAKQNTWDFIDGYTFAGINNRNAPPPYYGGHNKGLVTLDNKKKGKYMFVDKKSIEKTDGSKVDIQYIYDNYRKDIKYKVVSTGCEVSDAGTDLAQGRSLVIGAGKTSNDLPEYGGPASITWTNTYNWSGKNNRLAGAGIEVEAQEALILTIENDDYIATTSTIDEVNWVSGLSGSTVFETEAGCLTKENQYKWTTKISDFNIGYTGQQALFHRQYANYTNTDGSIEYHVSRNSYNGTGVALPLSFYVPTISKLKGNNIAVLDISNKIAAPAYYYSGIPILDVPKSAMTLNIKLKAKINKLISTAGSSGVTLAIKGAQFKNKPIGDEIESDLLFTKSYSASDLSKEIEISLGEDKLVGVREKTLWLKGFATNNNCSVTFETTDIYYTE